ncbi:Sec-independent protein translocase subunit TatA [Pseudonocardia spinosispora]|uniref:Sec-independent protein translocase subunit TatA n=1 Tax=Pseudonocardia spinosispora TaxID=103441 RepID=UPI0004242639
MPGGWEWVIILVVILLLFGAKRLPDMARSLGQSARVLKSEVKGMKSDDEARESQTKSDPPAEQQKPAALPPGQPSAAEPRAASEQPGTRSDDAR